MTKLWVEHACRVLGVAAMLASAAPLWADEEEASEKVVSSRQDTKLQVGNNRVTVVFDEENGDWDANWHGETDAAIRRAGLAIDVDGRRLTPQAATAETAPFGDALGRGMEIRQRWGKEIEIQRCVRLYDGRPAVVVSVQITNHMDRDVTLDAAKMLDLAASDQGSWRLGDSMRPPAAVGYPGAAPPCRPAPDETANGDRSHLPRSGPKAGTDAQRWSSHKGDLSPYTSQGVLALARPGSPGAMAIGCLSAGEGTPSIHADFQPGSGGTSLAATMNFGSKKKILLAGQTIVLDPVWLSVEADGYEALECYGDAVAALAPKPLRTDATALWCSWYPIRMGITEEIILAEAAVAAKHFRPLGLDVIQMDHGWQQGDLCGDWTPKKEQFPHGLKWLAEQLQSRYGMKMGLWIAPTQVAMTTRLFHDHPDWMKKNSQGKPVNSGRWFWAPNPEMTKLDVSHPAAEKWVEETIAGLKAEGVSYFKIDFISGAPSLPRAMAAVRRGAGPDAWIRFIQTPPLVSAGPANGVCVGPDTGDAGMTDWMRYSRENDSLLAASYWTNGRLFRREICDMSVGLKAGVEEARFRLSLMAMSGCSISFSDDLRLLDLPRIRLMQQCLPAGNPPARPLDLFDRELPSLWHMHCKNEAGSWDAVGVFNFEDRPQQRCVEFSALGLPAGAEAVAFEFWEEKFLGVHKDRITLTLAPRTARIVLIHRRPSRPQVIATNMHVLGGYHEIGRMAWDQERRVLSGQYRRAPGLEGRAYVYVPDGYRPLRPDAPRTKGFVRLSQVEKNLWVQEIRFERPQVDWAIPFGL